MDSCVFISFAIDGVSLKSLDIVTSSVNFWRGITNYNAGTDVKHNVKNDHYHELEGNSFMTAGNYVVDGDFFREASVAKELCPPKDFDSEKLVESLLSLNTQKRCQ